MEISLLNKGYKNNEAFYNAFLSNNMEEFLSDEIINLESAPDFPIYLNIADETERTNQFIQAFTVIANRYLHTDRDIHFDEQFWHSFLCTAKREYILNNYPQVKMGVKEFNNVVLKKFDWENYVYKCILGAQYVVDHVADQTRHEHYFRLIAENLDMFNYMLKYAVFRNGEFMINILDIIDEHDLSSTLKQKITWRGDLGKDERVGRRVLFEFNKSYPIVLFPMLSKEELEPLFFEYLEMYKEPNN